MGHSISLQDESEPNQVLLADPIPDFDVEEAQDSRNVLYKATFEELSEAHLQYDTTIWVLISLLLILAWGLGIVMLVFLPVRRYVLKKDISSRKLYITPYEIVYKATRPFFLPCLGINKIEKRIPLPLVIDIIIEQGCLQSVYGIHTFRVESIARGKAAPIDELQIQGVSDPGLLRKVIISEASKSIQGMGRIWKPTLYGSEVGNTPKKGIESLSGISSLIRSPSSKGMASPRHGLPLVKAVVPSDLLLHKLEEVKQSMQRIESLLVVPQERGESI